MTWDDKLEKLRQYTKSVRPDINGEHIQGMCMAALINTLLAAEHDVAIVVSRGSGDLHTITEGSRQ